LQKANDFTCININNKVILL